MYCRKCGAEIAADNDFCGKCGQRVAGSGTAEARRMERPQTVVLREKSEGAAAVLSLLWSGLGQIYVGRIARGLGIMLAYFLIWFVGIWFIVLGAMAGGTGGVLVVLLLIVVVTLALLVWSVFDAYNLAKEFNDRLRATGTRPW